MLKLDVDRKVSEEIQQVPGKTDVKGLWYGVKVKLKYELDT